MNKLKRIINIIFNKEDDYDNDNYTEDSPSDFSERFNTKTDIVANPEFVYPYSASSASGEWEIQLYAYSEFDAMMQATIYMKLDDIPEDLRVKQLLPYPASIRLYGMWCFFNKSKIIKPAPKWTDDIFKDMTMGRFLKK